MANCTTVSKTATQIITLYSVPVGIAPFTATFKKGSTVLATYTNVPENTTKIYVYTFLGTDVGIQTFSVTVTDSCIGSIPCIESCNVTVIPNICSWIYNLGGIGAITIANIVTLYYVYLGFTTLDFVPTVAQILGCEYYFLGFTGAGNSRTDCNY